jgi:hypothetical protein
VKLTPAWLAVVLVALIPVSASAAPAYDDTSRADAYLDQVATSLASPGVFVDPTISEISSAEADRLSALAARTPGPVRVAVIPADAIREADPATLASPYSYNPIAYPDDELAGLLYDRVGVDGTYAVLVDAPSADDGRSFTAYQFSEERPYYDVEGALDAAIDCCAPDYESMVTTFLENAGDEKTNPWPVLGWVVGVGGALIAGAFGISAWARRRRRRREDAEVTDALRPGLNEEVIALEQQVGALPASDTADVSARTRKVLDLVEEARHRLDDPLRSDTPSEIEEVVTRLADARYELVAIAALRAGQPVPERTAPCFFDPRHGPSVAERPFTPSYGSEREVPVCAQCRDTLDAKQTPAVYEIAVGGTTKPYWDWDRISRPYVNGYWNRFPFADDRVQRTRYGAPAAPRRRSLVDSLGSDGPSQFVWESDRPSGGGGGSFWSSGGGSSRRRRSSSSGRSRSRRSFGGGSSRRSSRRSGGSRRF